MSNIPTTGNVVVVSEERKIIISPVAEAGVGVPVGGQTDQALLKNSATDYDTVWSNVVLEITGDGVDNTDPKRPTLSFPTLDEIGAYSNTNPDNFVNAQGAAASAPVQSVNGQTNVVILSSDDVGAYSNTNPENYINVAQAATAAPVQSVNGQTNVVVLGADDVGAYSNTNPENYINVAQASAAAPIQTVIGDGVDNTNVGNVVISYPTVDDIGAYSNTNPANYINVAQASAAAPVQSVNGQTNVVVLGADDVGSYSNTNPANYINVSQAAAAAPVQSVNGQTNIVVLGADDVGAYSNTNPANYINIAQAAAAAPVQSVNGQTNVVILNADDIGAYSNTNPNNYVNASGAAAVAPIQTVTGDGVNNTNVGNVVISYPTIDDIGAYSNTNPANYINVAQASASAPVQSVNGQTNVVILGVDDIGAYSNTNPNNYINIAQAAAAAPVQSVNGQTNVVNLALDDLTDVNTTNASNGQTLVYNSTALAWEAVFVSPSGVQSVTGDGVDNTDPANPVLSFPTVDDIGAYSNTNPDNYINIAEASAAAPVQSVNGQTNVVVLTADDVGAYSNTNPSAFVNATGAADAAPIQTITGDGVDNSNIGNVVISFPTLDQIGAYSNTNPAAYINVAQASASAPVQSVNGQTNIVVLNADDVGAYSNTNPNNYINIAQASNSAPVQSVNGQTGNVSVFDGGLTGDILVKNSNTNYDTSWTDSITVDKITYDIAAAELLTAEGQTAWDSEARTLAINKGNDVIQDITQALNYPLSFNADSITLTRGMLVMVDPAQQAQGNNLRIVRYVSNGTYPSDLFVGMVIEDIDVSETGFVNWFGQIQGLSLSGLQPSGEAWAEGDILWPNPSIAGGMTKFEPSAPSHKITVAAILRINGNTINLLLRPNLRSKLVDLHDVQITNVSNSQILSWNGTSWVNSNNEADGVLSVTGDGVDNTDPQNPVLSFPTLDDIGAYSNTNPAGYVNALGAADAAPIQSITGDGVDNSNVGNVVISYPTVDDIGAYSNTNPANYINVAQAADAAPVQSVNGQTNIVLINVSDLNDTNIINTLDGQVLSYQSGEWVNSSVESVTSLQIVYLSQVFN
jgi:hypothetical protein